MPDSAKYREVTEPEATEAGLPAQPDTTYAEQDGETWGYNAGTGCCWKLGRSPFGDSDEQRSAVRRAMAAANEAFQTAIEQAGGHVVCSVLIVHVDGVAPNGGVEAWTSDDGPEDPDDLLAFALHGVQQLAARYGLPFQTITMPEATAQRPQG